MVSQKERETDMISGMRGLGIRFDIDRIDATVYGFECWKTFWQSVDVNKLAGGHLFEGDTADTLDGNEKVFCIAVQVDNPNVLSEISDNLERDAEFQRIAVYPEFHEGSELLREPLVDAGRVDSSGKLVGGIWSQHALEALAKDEKSIKEDFYG